MASKVCEFVWKLQTPKKVNLLIVKRRMCKKREKKAGVDPVACSSLSVSVASNVVTPSGAVKDKRRRKQILSKSDQELFEQANIVKKYKEPDFDKLFAVHLTFFYEIS